ncbi:MAG: hypothetical protein NTZ33_15445 [Bacteroidetes bacterium]|nr:hypothetical protein [Bacteroidota bacterium]
MITRNYTSNYYTGECRFGFNGKEKDDEVKGTGNSLDFGARIYDPRIGRWLSVDPKAAKYPFLSPFEAFENNPICILDPGGDTTLYYNQNGDLLHTSYDKLSTAITIITDKNLKHFTISLKIFKGKGGKDDLSSFNMPNERWRKMGLTIDVKSLRTFYNKNTIVGKDNLSEESPTGQYTPGFFNESKSNLYNKNGNINIGSKTIKGGLTTVAGFPEDEPEMGNKIGTIHDHPNEGLSTGFGTGEYHPSLDADYPNQGNLDIIVGREQIYIYGKSMKNDIVVDKKTLEKGSTQK